MTPTFNLTIPGDHTAEKSGQIVTALGHIGVVVQMTPAAQTVTNIEPSATTLQPEPLDTPEAAPQKEKYAQHRLSKDPDKSAYQKKHVARTLARLHSKQVYRGAELGNIFCEDSGYNSYSTLIGICHEFGLLKELQRGLYQITEEGIQFAAENYSPPRIVPLKKKKGP